MAVTISRGRDRRAKLNGLVRQLVPAVPITESYYTFYDDVIDRFQVSEKFEKENKNTCVAKRCSNNYLIDSIESYYNTNRDIVMELKFDSLNIIRTGHRFNVPEFMKKSQRLFTFFTS